MYKIKDKPLGTTMEENIETKEKAEEIVQKLEELDKQDGMYEPNWYVILPMQTEICTSKQGG